MALHHIRETQVRALREISMIHSIEGGLQRLFPEEPQELSAIGLQKPAAKGEEAVQAS